MSVTLLLTVWKKFPEGDARLNALLAIAGACNDQGNCYVTVRQLSASARLSRSSVVRAVRKLREDRWIVTDRILGQGGRLVYQLNLPKLARIIERTPDPEALRA